MKKIILFITFIFLGAAGFSQGLLTFRNVNGDTLLLKMTDIQMAFVSGSYTRIVKVDRGGNINVLDDLTYIDTNSCELFLNIDVQPNGSTMLVSKTQIKDIKKSGNGARIVLEGNSYVTTTTAWAVVLAQAETKIDCGGGSGGGGGIDSTHIYNDSVFVFEGVDSFFVGMDFGGDKWLKTQLENGNDVFINANTTTFDIYGLKNLEIETDFGDTTGGIYLQFYSSKQYGELITHPDVGLKLSNFDYSLNRGGGMRVIPSNNFEIELHGQRTGGSPYAYTMPYSEPSTTLNTKRVMTWTGTGSDAAPAFEDPANISTWLKTELEAGNVVDIETPNHTHFQIGDGVTNDFDWANFSGDHIGLWVDPDNNGYEAAAMYVNRQEVALYQYNDDFLGILIDSAAASLELINIENTPTVGASLINGRFKVTQGRHYSDSSFVVDRIGVVELPKYADGAGNFTASALGKTESDTALVLATDGTLLKKPISEFGGGSDGNGMWTASNNNIPVAVDSIKHDTKLDWLYGGTAGVTNEFHNYNLTVTGEDDTAMRFNYRMDDDAGNPTDFARVDVIAANVGNTLEKGIYRVGVTENGTVKTVADFNMDSGNASIGNTTMASTISAMNTTQRNALTATSGMMVYNTTVSEYQFYNGSSWLSIDDPGNNTIDGSGTTNSVPKFSDSNTLTDSNISDNGTTVTIDADVAGGSDILVIDNTNVGATATVTQLQTGFGSNNVRLDLANTSDATNAKFELAADGTVNLENASTAGLRFTNDRLSVRSTALKTEPVTAATAAALTPANGDIVANNSANTGEFKLDDATNFYENGRWVDRLEYHIATEVSGASETAAWKKILPYDVTSNTGAVSIPSGAVEGDWFAVSDSRGNALLNNITIDFVGGSYNFHGASANEIIGLNNEFAKFVFVNSTIGFIRID